MNIVLLGPPGAGKGTVASKLKDALSLPHISTGDLFRAHIKNKTELGTKVQQIIESGGLVPDEITTEMVRQRLSESDAADGFLLDGYPRTIGQAEALKGIAKIDHVLNYGLDDEEIIRRLSGRRLCKSCGESFHEMFLPPKTAGICDKCGGELYTRKDDSEESIRTRLEVYNSQTQPLIDYYTEAKLIRNIDASAKPEQVLEYTLKLLA